MTRKLQKDIIVGFVSLGCPKNTVDSERMLAQIAQAGLLITNEPDNADVVVINTCCKKRGWVKKVVVAGCLAERMGKQLFSEVDGIDAVIGLDKRDSIVRIIKETISAEAPAAYLSSHRKRHSDIRLLDDRTRLLITPSHWTYLRISEGCNHRCSFCTIPSIRGPFRSKPLDIVLDEANELVSAGAVELNLIAQDTANYGRDSNDIPGLTTLLTELVKVETLAWIRLMYLYPAGIDENLIETVAANQKIVNYFDIPIQHVNNRILKAMRRPNPADNTDNRLSRRDQRRVRPTVGLCKVGEVRCLRLLRLLPRTRHRRRRTARPDPQTHQAAPPGRDYARPAGNCIRREHAENRRQAGLPRRFRR